MKLKTLITIGLLLAAALTVIELCLYPALFDREMSPLAQGNWFNWIAGLYVATCVAEIFGFFIIGGLIYTVRYFFSPFKRSK